MHPDTLAAIHLAIAEDIGSGDITSESCVPADRLATGYFLAREAIDRAVESELRGLQKQLRRQRRRLHL